MKQPVVLCILDGWGISKETKANSITLAHCPTWKRFMRTYPKAELQASEGFVGLPLGQMGNSEVGHTCIGLGRVLLQDLPKIDQALLSGTFKSLPTVQKFSQNLQKSGGACHLLGLVSPGGVHSHQDHIIGIAKMILEMGISVKLHAFLDGRDTPPKSAVEYCQNLISKLGKYPIFSIATLSGRYYAMDRDKRWDRIEKSYDAITFGKAQNFVDPIEAIHHFYKSDISDEFIPPITIGDYKGVIDSDGLFMANFRADRVREILKVLLESNKFSCALGMNEYSKELTPLIESVFDKDVVNNSLGEVVSSVGIKQLRVAETEKYAHVTFFFNGGRETVFLNEDRIMVPSPNIATYDLQPEMSANAITDRVTKALQSKEYGLIVVNYANTDMVGHTGDLNATIKAVETVDQCLSKLEQECIRNGYALLITADHGNAEQMLDIMTGAPHTAHTCNPVPVVLVNGTGCDALKNGSLCDVAPTVLDLLGYQAPSEITGKTLLIKSLDPIPHPISLRLNNEI